VGGVTPSKFSNTSGGQLALGVGVGVDVAVALGEAVGVGDGVPPARLNAPTRNRHPFTLVVGMYSLTYQKSWSLLGSTVMSV